MIDVIAITSTLIFLGLSDVSHQKSGQNVCFVIEMARSLPPSWLGDRGTAIGIALTFYPDHSVVADQVRARPF